DGQQLFVGLGQDTSDSTAYAFDYAFRFYGNGTWEIDEGGSFQTSGQGNSGDVYSISIDGGGVVTYYDNGSLVYTSSTSAAGTYVAHASLQSMGADVTNAVVDGSGGGGGNSGGGGNTLRVLQWNVDHGGLGEDGVLDPNRIANWAASFNPDIISFNEIEKNDSWGNEDQPALFASLMEQLTGKTWYYVFAQEWGEWDAAGKGNLILSTYPINSSDEYELTNNYDRSIAEVQITVNNLPITFMSTHLEPYDPTLRLTQATEVVGWTASQPENRILAGDMNAWPNEACIGVLDSAFNDSWAVAVNNGTAVAFPGNNGETRNGRIDYIFYSQNAPNLTVQSSQVYDARDANGLMPSDHRPVLTTFIVQ
ncbi:MAG TPA: endonuclease/exonuclease/phosphatase family protein, partial [Vicinamibacterales bacterium]